MFLSERPWIDMVCEVASVRDIQDVMRATPVDVILLDYELSARQEESIDVLLARFDEGLDGSCEFGFDL